MDDTKRLEYKVELEKDGDDLVLVVESPIGGGFRVSSELDLESLVREVGKGFDSLDKGERYMVLRMIQQQFFLHARRYRSNAANAQSFYEHLLTARIIYLDREVEELKRKH